jgi:hypothetical protein
MRNQENLLASGLRKFANLGFQAGDLAGCLIPDTPPPGMAWSGACRARRGRVALAQGGRQPGGLGLLLV